MINFKELQKKQEVLDNFIYKENGITYVSYIELDKIIALDIELSEFMNEVKSFKYWKKNKDIDRVKVLEEASDCLHFILSLANDNNIDLSLNVSLFNIDINKCFSHIKKYIWYDIYLGEEWGYLKLILKRLINILIQLDFTYEDLIQSYNNKYEINIKRQREGY